MWVTAEGGSSVHVGLTPDGTPGCALRRRLASVDGVPYGWISEVTVGTPLLRRSGHPGRGVPTTSVSRGMFLTVDIFLFFQPFYTSISIGNCTSERSCTIAIDNRVTL